MNLDSLSFLISYDRIVIVQLLKSTCHCLYYLLSLQSWTRIEFIHGLYWIELGPIALFTVIIVLSMLQLLRSTGENSPATTPYCLQYLNVSLPFLQVQHSLSVTFRLLVERWQMQGLSFLPLKWSSLKSQIWTGWINCDCIPVSVDFETFS